MGKSLAGPEIQEFRKIAHFQIAEEQLWRKQQAINLESKTS